jgi:hypothetical protein
MINLTVVIAILFIHWVADFICQTDWQAKNKSKSNKALLIHTFIYSGVWLIPALFMFNSAISAVLFFIITFICHTATDYFTSRLNSKLWAQGKVHWFFVAVGFDQILHYVQLLLTYQVLK